jgi:hypothetical protein
MIRRNWLNTGYTSRKFIFSAIVVIGILFTTAFQIQPARAGTPPKAGAAKSLPALSTSSGLPGQAGAPLTTVSAVQASRGWVNLMVTEPSENPGAHSIATPTAAPDPNLPSLESFIDQVRNGEASTLVGIYGEDIMALRIVQQPNGDPAYIDLMDGTATQFYKASLFGAIGLLAHNNLSGGYFFEINLGADLVLVYGDGRTSHYTVSEIGDYQRLSLSDLRSDFMDLATNQKKSVDEVFAHYYQQEQVLTLQTCIAQNGISDWGVRFILARPSSDHSK